SCLIGSFLMASELPSQRVIPHLAAASSGVSTQVLVYNQSHLEKTITLHPYNSQGQALGTVELTLAARASWSRPAQEVFGEKPVSHFFVSGSTRVLVSVNFSYQGQSAS